MLWRKESQNEMISFIGLAVDISAQSSASSGIPHEKQASAGPFHYFIIIRQLQLSGTVAAFNRIRGTRPKLELVTILLECLSYHCFNQ